MCLLLIVPILAMLFFDLGKTSCKTKPQVSPMRGTTLRNLVRRREQSYFNSIDQ
jgi:hypothetical protein